MVKNSLYYGVQQWNFDDAEGLLDEFLELYDSRPIRDNRGGMQTTHMFWTWYAIRKLCPENIIESGVYKGQGTWLLQQASPRSRVYAIDPVLEKRVYIDESVTYFTQDFSLINWTKYLNPEDTLIFFDDHQNAYTRLQQMKWMGFKKAMFEDNYPCNRGDCYSLKQVFEKCGSSSEAPEDIPPNAVHAEYCLNNLKSYTTFPPLYKPEKTRFEDEWNEKNYPTGEAVLSLDKAEKYPLIKEEAAASYTWLCYAELK